MRKFRGFNPKQMEMISQRLGYNGPSEGFQSYLDQTPDKAAKFSRMNNRAKTSVEGQPQVQEGMGPAMGKAPPDNQLTTQGGRVVTPQEQQAQAGVMPQGQPQGPSTTPVQAPQPNVMAQPSVMPGQMPLSINPPNTGMPTWSNLPEGTTGAPDFSKPQIGNGAPNLSYMAEGGDVKKRKRANPQKDQNKREEEFRDKGSKDKVEPSPLKDVDPITKSTIKKPEEYITPVKSTDVEKTGGQFIHDKGNVVGKTATVENTSTATATTAKDPTKTDAHTVDASLVGDDVRDVAEGTEAAQGTVSAQSQVEAAQALPSSDATVQGQLTKLMTQFEGGQTPPWAAGAMRMANAAMGARGLGASSMAGSAITQAAMESAIGIAVADASTFSQFEMQNLNNRQQARLQNAQAFLQMDMANLNNRQQTELFKSQAIIQGLFTDQAAENATKQFNATSQNQTDQFFANLKTQVSTFNAAQKNAISMFNSEQKNATKQFNATQKNMIKQFNAQNRLVIDQANAQWRQQIATINNANTNEANRINAQAATGLTMAGFNNLWQQERDLMAYAFTAAENMNQRAHEVLLAKMGVDLEEDMADQASKDGLMKMGGQFVASLFDDVDFGDLI
jgi:hypothetical protein